MRKTFVSFLMALTGSWVNAGTYIDAEGLMYDYDETTFTSTVCGTYKAGRVLNYYQGTTLDIPASVNIDGMEYKVTSIETKGFQSSPNLTTVAVPASVALAEGSFYGCSLLKDITLGEGISCIPQNCFSKTAITDLSFLPSSVTAIGGSYSNYAYVMEDGAFCYCDGLESAVVPPNVKVLGPGTFSNCKNLKSVVLSEGLKLISSNCFSYSTELSQINFPSTLQSIQRNAFYNCPLTSVDLPDGVNFIGANAFFGTALTSIKLPAALESCRMASWGKTAISSLSVPSGVKRIMPRAFYQMQSLTKLVFEDSEETLDFDYHANNAYGRDPWVDYAQESDALGEWINPTKIEELYVGRNVNVWINPDYEFPAESRSGESQINPFYTMDVLRSITVGAEVTDASQLVFENYPMLEEISFLGEIPPVLNPLSASQTGTVRVSVPAGSIEAYKSVPGWAGVVNMDESASIAGVIIDNDNADAPVYNLQGIRMNAVSLPTGVYIRNGKKFVIK